VSEKSVRHHKSTGPSLLSIGDWKWLKTQSRSKTLWFQLEWWHNKYYRHNPPNDGFVVQVPRIGKPEVPYKRAIFYPSPHSRFSLGSKLPVAYFSSDFVINCCETIDQFSSDNNLSWNELSRYLAGGMNPTPGWYGFPLSHHLSDDCLVLDLSKNTAAFFTRIQKNLGHQRAKAVWRVIRSRVPSDKRKTQLVAKEAHKHGYHGIVYASVRAPVDVAMPEWNLVIFDPSKIRNGGPPRKRFPRAGADYKAWLTKKI
jgi:RES domain